MDEAIQLAFIDAFRLIELIAARLAFLNAGIAVVMVERRSTALAVKALRS